MNVALWWGVTDAVGAAVFVALVAMSIMSWCVGLARLGRRLRARSNHRAFLADFQHPQDAPTLAELAGRQSEHHPHARLAREVFAALDAHRRPGPREIEAEPLQGFLQRVSGHALEVEQARLERGMSLLSTIAATAPFVGLFGTVWGIHHALATIAASGQAGLADLAGPVGEALVMTGFGLFVAVPAVLFHNWLARDNRLLLLSLAGFVHSLLTRLSTGHAPAAATARLREARRAVAS